MAEGGDSASIYWLWQGGGGLAPRATNYTQVRRGIHKTVANDSAAQASSFASQPNALRGARETPGVVFKLGPTLYLSNSPGKVSSEESIRVAAD